MTSHDVHESDQSDPPTESGPETKGEPPLVFEFRVPVGAVGLAETLPEFPDAIVELEQLVPTKGAPIPYLWLTDVAGEDPSIERISRLAAFTEGALYKVEWADEESLLQRFVDGEEAVLQADGSDDGWTLKLRFESRGRLDDFRRFCDDREIDFEVIRLYDLTEPKMGQYNISEKQRTALVKALRMGNFNIPHDAKLDDLANELGISQRAAPSVSGAGRRTS